MLGVAKVSMAPFFKNILGDFPKEIVQPIVSPASDCLFQV